MVYVLFHINIVLYYMSNIYLRNKNSQAILSKRGINKNTEAYKTFGTEG